MLQACSLLSEPLGKAFVREALSVEVPKGTLLKEGAALPAMFCFYLLLVHCLLGMCVYGDMQ